MTKVGGCWLFCFVFSSTKWMDFSEGRGALLVVWTWILFEVIFFWPLGHKWNRCVFATGHSSGKLCQSTMKSLWNSSILPESWLLQTGILKKALWTGFQVIDRNDFKKKLCICLIMFAQWELHLVTYVWTSYVKQPLSTVKWVRTRPVLGWSLSAKEIWFL